MPDLDPTHAAGLAFERHVMGLFGKDFKILSWMQDGTRTKEEIDFSPDLVVQHIESGEVFGVECKYRSTHFFGKLTWAKEYQLKKYDRYRATTGHKLFIVIGLGGTPEKPDYMYCIPAWQATRALIDKDSVKRYRRDPRRKFKRDPRTHQLT